MAIKAGIRQLEVRSNALDHTTIGGERQLAVSGNTLDHTTIGAGPSDNQRFVLWSKKGSNIFTTVLKIKKVNRLSNSISSYIKLLLPLFPTTVHSK